MKRRSRALLAAGLALAPGAALAQSPSGGRVVAGQASIAQTLDRTQVNQSTDRAVIEWQRFDVGAGHQVDIRQPAASSWSLQRVTGGDPSSIAGRVTSNGGVALVNPAGVLFHQGAQVDVAALIATTSDITNQNFQSGRMVFDGAPRPGARVENRGTITVAQRGLAALVGPQVANSGNIRARLGRVALAGGEAFALDLAGDGLLSLDVTRQVTSAPSGATALVTNSGSIEAQGGSVLLTAHAASGVLESLVSAGGSIAAGQVALRATGGGVTLPGQISGNTVEATATGMVRVASGATVTATDGRIAIGAGLESRPGAPVRLAARTVVEPGATLRAERGNVLVHAAERTDMRGTISAPGGSIEVSSRGALALDGVLDAAQVLIDPLTLRIVASLTGSAEPAEITAATINATTGALTLQAERTIRVDAAVNKTSGPLTLETTNPVYAAGQGIQINRTLAVTGDLILRSAGDITQAASGATVRAGTLSVRSTDGSVLLNSPDNVIRALDGGGAAGRFDIASRVALSVDAALDAAGMALTTTQGLSLFAPITVTGTLDLNAVRGITQSASGAGVTAGQLRFDAATGAVALTGTGNRITTLGDSGAPRGFSLVNETGLQVVGGVSATNLLSLTARSGDLTQTAASRIVTDALQALAPQGSVLFDAPLNAISSVYGRALAGFSIATGGALQLAAPVTATEVTLAATGDIGQDQGARLIAETLRISADGAVTLTDAQNQVDALGAIRADGGFALTTATALSVTDAVTAPSVSLRAGANLTLEAGSAISADRLGLTTTGGSVRMLGAGHSFNVLTASGASADFRLATPGALSVEGALTVGGSLVLEAASLALEDRITAGDATLRARSSDITQTAAGRIAAGRLTAEAAGGNILLDAAPNAVSRFGGRALGDLRLTSTLGLAPAPDLGLTAARIALSSAGAIVQDVNASAGITATRLDAIAGGRVNLRSPLNAIEELGLVQAPGGLAVTTSTALLLTSPITTTEAVLTTRLGLAQLTGATLSADVLRVAATAGDVILAEGANALPRLGTSRATGTLRISTGTALAIEGPVTAGATLELQAQGDITQAASGARLGARLLRARSLQGNVLLTGAGNDISALGTGGAAGEFAFAQDGAALLQLEGPVSAPSLFFRLASGLDDQAGGALRGGMLRLETNGVVRLSTSGQHVLTAVGGSVGDLSLSTLGSLTVAESLTSQGLLALVADSLAFAAPAAAASASLAARDGDITQSLQNAGVSAGLLGARSNTGSVFLDGQGNQVAALANSSAVGSFALAQEGSAALRLNGNVSANDLFFRVQAGLTDAGGGALSANTLRLDTAGTVSLAAAGRHTLGSVGGQAGALSLATGAALRVGEALNVTGALTLAAESLALDAPVTAGAARFTARSGDIVQAFGLTVGDAGLVLSARGAITLDSADNAITRLAGASATGVVTVASGSAMAVAGTVSGADVVLRAGGPMRLEAATLEADRAILLAAPQGFSAGAASRVRPRSAGALPVLILDSRQAGGLTAIPLTLAADIPGLTNAQQPTQLADFGAPRGSAGGPVVFDLNAGSSPVFLLMDAGASVGSIEAGRFGISGQGGSAFIVGALAGIGGTAAAEQVSVVAPQANYLFNNCVIAAVNCGIVPEAPGPVDPVVPTPPTTPEVVLPEVPGLPGTPSTPGATLLASGFIPLGAGPLVIPGDLRLGAPALIWPWTRREEEEE